MLPRVHCIVLYCIELLIIQLQLQYSYTRHSTFTCFCARTSAQSPEPAMLSKFETKSNRVKGLSFHAKRPWILASLHSGSIQLWDYKLGTLVEKFDEHEGPVRAVCFHHVQPLFVSGGDDYKIKVWNWKLGRSLFTLTGHLDYIRTVSFHNEAPWIVSCGDDQTIRIWNWQSRTCISVLTGHSHYVMSASFHHSQDLLVSACLDQTVRVWDITGLRKKHAAGAPSLPSMEERFGGPGSSGSHPGAGNPDVFGNLDCVVKYVLEGHSRGVNWAAFHPTLPLIVSCGDDRLIKLWRMNDSKAWEVDTCRGHFNNVAGVLFHARQDVIVSASEDKTIRVWDMTKRTCISTFRREHDRFWFLVSHPTMNLFAAGHDSGLIVFKLERERPAYDIHNDVCYYVSEKSIRAYNFATATDTPLIFIKRGHPGQSPPPRTLTYNPAEHSVLISMGKEDGAFEIYGLPRTPSGQPSEVEPKRGAAASAIYLTRNRFATVEKGKLLIKDLNNITQKELNVVSVDGKAVKIVDIFGAGPAGTAGKQVLVSSASSVMLFDTDSRSSTAEAIIIQPRYVSWSPDFSHIALIAKHNIVIATKDLEYVTTIHETVKIKSAIWDTTPASGSGILMYTTLSHIKYALKNGDTGIVKTIEEPLYIVRAKNSTIHCLGRDGKMVAVSFDPTELQFKLALVNRHYDQVFHLIKTSNLMGQSIIGYLQKKGYPEIALQFVKDPKTRFDLAIECGNIDVALEMATSIDKEQYWNKLGVQALRQGNQAVLEFVYQKTKNFDKLSFLYVCTGNSNKLKKMVKIAEARSDPMARFQNAVYAGDVEEQVETLLESGQLSLAYLSAKTHGLEEKAASILEQSGLESAPLGMSECKLARAPLVVLRLADTNWPLLQLSKNIFEGGNGDITGIDRRQSAVTAPSVILDEKDLQDVGNWGDEDLEGLDGLGIGGRKKSAAANPVLDIPEGEGWDIEGDLDISDGFSVGGPISPKVQNGKPESFQPGVSVETKWIRNSNLAVDHIAAGSFESAMQLLFRQVGIVNFVPLKPFFMTIYQTSHSFLAATPSTHSLVSPLLRSFDPSEGTRSRPNIVFTPARLIAKIQQAYPVMTQGRFNDAVGLFRSILQQAVLTLAQNNDETSEVMQIITVCREYLLGLSLETARRDLGNEKDPKRALELAAYFTHCQLQTVHLQLAIRLAMVQAFKMRNFGTAKGFALRLLEQGPVPQVASSANKILQHCEKNTSNSIALDYDQYNTFSTCAASLTPIYQGSPGIVCPYCQASYRVEYQDSLCSVCQLAKIGARANGHLLTADL